MSARALIRIGTAGWALPRALHDHFAGDGPHLARYAREFAGAEINSSFHRPHRPSTYAKWAASVPEDFRFSVKLPKTITHECRLVKATTPLSVFLADVQGLGARLGCLLVQFPPSLVFAAPEVEPFFITLRDAHAGDVAVEPRHASWFSAQATSLLVAYRMARVAADPACVPAAAVPGAWDDVRYWRLHGSPRMYYSSYADAEIGVLARKLRRAERGGKRVWCIFDNTTLGAATANAMALRTRLG